MDIGPHVDALCADGITSLSGAFSQTWAEQMREDDDRILVGYSKTGRAVGRGPRRTPRLSHVRSC